MAHSEIFDPYRDPNSDLYDPYMDPDSSFYDPYLDPGAEWDLPLPELEPIPPPQEQECIVIECEFLFRKEFTCYYLCKYVCTDGSVRFEGKEESCGSTPIV